ncbi:MAG TPA: hypothetical protein VNK49_11855 [Anaerolineales bacterium]|nr:hypothetical protein [Anaerolineales bacterium]
MKTRPPCLRDGLAKRIGLWFNAHTLVIVAYRNVQRLNSPTKVYSSVMGMSSRPLLMSTQK